MFPLIFSSPVCMHETLVCSTECPGSSILYPRCRTGASSPWVVSIAMLIEKAPSPPCSPPTHTTELVTLWTYKLRVLCPWGRGGGQVKGRSRVEGLQLSLAGCRFGSASLAGSFLVCFWCSLVSYIPVVKASVPAVSCHGYK